MDNIKRWTGLVPVEESVRMTEDRSEESTSMVSMVWPTLGSRTAKEQNRIIITVGV